MSEIGLYSVKMRKGVLIKSVFDLYVVYEYVLASVTEMEIDNDRKSKFQQSENRRESSP